jgi:hypothetical protein
MPKSRDSPVEKKITKDYNSMRGTCHRSIHALNGSLEPNRPSLWVFLSRFSRFLWIFNIFENNRIDFFGKTP